jgi:hypothetical protein
MPYGGYHFATGAGWTVYWRILQQQGSGLEVWFADFSGKRVLWRGSAPFVLVPYHRPHPGNEPPGPEHTYKDGISPKCGGADFTALKHGTPNTWAGWNDWAVDDTEAVVVSNQPADDFGPAVLSITAKFQCGWYQYVHRWEFTGDGVIRANIGLGGQLNPNIPGVAHFHHFYFRLDFDIDGYPNDVVEVFAHNSLVNPGGDQWTAVANQGRLVADSATARKWRVRDTVRTNPLGQFRGYEIELPQTAGRDQYSTGDVWVTVYRGDSVQQGQDVGGACNDAELANVYAVGPLSPGTGNDIVLWVALRTHHEPRNQGEERTLLPYHYEGFTIAPRNFD